MFRDILVYRSQSIAAGTISTQPGSCSGRWDVRRDFTRMLSSLCCWSVSSRRGSSAARQVGRSVGWSVGNLFRRKHSACSSVGRSVGRLFIDSAVAYVPVGMFVIRSIVRLVSHLIRRNHRYFPQSVGRSIGRSMIPPQPSGRSSRQSVGQLVGRSLIPPLPGVPRGLRLRLSYGGRTCASVLAFGRKSVYVIWFLWRGCLCSCFLTPSLLVLPAFDSGFCFWSCNLTTSLTLVLFSTASVHLCLLLKLV